MDLHISMKCPHCCCLMIHEKFFGPGEPFWGWRCIHCGEIVDDTVLENRTTQGEGRRILKNPEMRKRTVEGGPKKYP